MKARWSTRSTPSPTAVSRPSSSTSVPTPTRSIALRDALAASDKPAIEVHISDIKKRENFRHTSMTAGACRAMICGKGFPGYVEALQLLKTL